MKCTICNTEIKGRYWVDAWQQPICDCHKVEYCYSCDRFVKPTDLHLADGRCLCPVCQPSAVFLPQHIEWVEKRVRPILARHGITGIPQVPIQLVTPEEMAVLNRSGQINLFRQGLTATVQTTGWFSSKSEHTVYIFTQLPRIQFAGVLAHELLHVWQHEKHIQLPSDLTEGFCNVGSFATYESIGNDLSRHLIRKMEENPDPVYGDGFRKVVAIYKQTGANLIATMNLLKP